MQKRVIAAQTIPIHIVTHEHVLLKYRVREMKKLTLVLFNSKDDNCKVLKWEVQIITRMDHMTNYEMKEHFFV